MAINNQQCSAAHGKEQTKRKNRSTSNQDEELDIIGVYTNSPGPLGLY